MKTAHYFLVGFTAVLLLALPITANNTGTAVAQINDFPPVAYLPIIVSGDPTIGPVHNGIATYYAATGEGNCLFPASPDNLMVAAMNDVDYGNADLCGAYIRVDGRKGSVVRIVDRCPECAQGHVDMSPQAFALIDDLPLGRVPISGQIA